MRLIDADEVIKFYNEEFPSLDNGVHWSRNDIIMNLHNIPTVEAIPIKYIEAFKKEFRAVASVKAVIEWLLEKWEDEQARLFEKQITEECVSAERFAEWEKENADTD